jgi:hypothetical protein
MLTRSIFVSILLLVSLLVGCASAPLPTPTTSSDKPSIYKVKEDLKARLAKDDRLQGSKIDFYYDGATVILNGTVKDREQFGWAATIAAGTPGVTSVINRLQVEPPAAETAVPEAPVPKKQVPKPQTLPSPVPSTTAQTQN